MGKNIKCCKDCADRWRDLENGKACHDHCEKYQEEKQARIEYKELNRPKQSRANFNYCTKNRNKNYYSKLGTIERASR